MCSVELGTTAAEERVAAETWNHTIDLRSTGSSSRGLYDLPPRPLAAARSRPLREGRRRTSTWATRNGFDAFEMEPAAACRGRGTGTWTRPRTWTTRCLVPHGNGERRSRRGQAGVRGCATTHSESSVERVRPVRRPARTRPVVGAVRLRRAGHAAAASARTRWPRSRPSPVYWTGRSCQRGGVRQAPRALSPGPGGRRRGPSGPAASGGRLNRRGPRAQSVHAAGMDVEATGRPYVVR